MRNLELKANPLGLTANGKDVSTLTATFDGCNLEIDSNIEVSFKQTPSGTNHGVVDFSLVTTDTEGKATNFFTAGTLVDDYEITATVGKLNPIEAKVTIKVTPPVRAA